MVDKLPTKAGIDPLNKLIDRNPEDNVVKVEKVARHRTMRGGFEVPWAGHLSCSVCNQRTSVRGADSHQAQSEDAHR